MYKRNLFSFLLLLILAHSSAIAEPYMLGKKAVSADFQIRFAGFGYQLTAPESVVSDPALEAGVNYFEPLMTRNSLIRNSVVKAGMHKMVSVGPDLKIEKTTPKFLNAFGDRVTYTIRVINVGTTTETGAKVTDVLPAGLRFISASANYNPANGEWLLPSMAPGDTVTMTLLTEITGGDVIVNLATVALRTGRTDVDGNNNFSAAGICASPPKPGTITGSDILCVADSNRYSVTAIMGVGYEWFVPPTWTIISGQGGNSIQVKPGADTLTAHIYVRAITTCDSSALDSIRITAVKKPDSLSVITGDTLVCENAIGKVYKVVGGYNVDSYTWTVPNGWVITAGQGTDSITVNASPDGGEITVEGSNICGLSPKSILAITVAKLPLALGDIILPFPGDPCVGQDSLIFSILPATDVTQYNWEVPADWTILNGQGTDSILVIVGATGGLVSVTGENNCGLGPVSTMQITPAVTAPTQPPVIAGDIFPCIGQVNATYSIPPQPGVSAYAWSVPADWTILTGETTNTITVQVGSLTDTVKVAAINGCGTGISSALAVTPQTAPPTEPVAVIAGPGESPCIGQTNFIYTVAPVSGASGYTWTVPAGWAIASGQGTDSIVVFAGSNGGVVSVTADNGCGSSTPVLLPVIPVASPPANPIVILGDQIPCIGNTNTVYSVPATAGAVSYTWTVPAGWTINSGWGTDSIEVTPGNTGGIISVMAENSCGSSAAATLAVNGTTVAPAVPTGIQGLANVCLNQTGLTYSVTPDPLASAYFWTVPQGWTITSGQGTSIISVSNVTSAGVISVSAANGCGSSTDTTLAITFSTVAPGPANPVSGNLTPCIGQTAAIYSTTAVPGAASYAWTVPAGWTIVSGQGTDTIVVSVGSRNGNISVTPENGCGNGAFSTLVVRPSNSTLPVVGQINGNAVPCIGQTRILYSVAGIPGVTAYNWVLPTGWTITSGLGSNSIEVTAGSTVGEIELTVANVCGTSLPKTLAVTPVSSAPDSSGTISGLAQPCQGRTTTYITTGAARASLYTWTVPAGWAILSGQGNDTVTVRAGNAVGVIRVTASNGCGAGVVSTFIVSPNTTPPVLTGLISGRDRVCEGEDNLTYTIASVAGASSYNWTVPDTWQVISGQGTTNLVVKAGDTGGNVMVEAINDCGRSATVIFVVNVRKTPVIPGRMQIENLSCTTRRYSITPVAEASDYFWTVPKGWTITRGQRTTSIQVTVSADTGTVAVAVQNDGCSGPPLKLKVSGDIQVEVPNAFSPNDDGINDMWEIPELEGYPDNEVTVINRWGNEVFRQKNYQQRWNGKDLAAGTYYYILRVKLCNDVEKTFKGYVMIVR